MASDPNTMPDAVRQWFRDKGAEGGRKRWADKTDAERSEYMRQLAAKRKHPGRKPKTRD